MCFFRCQRRKPTHCDGTREGVDFKQPTSKPMASASVIQVTKENFDAEVLQSTVPVVVDFWAEWCGPCKMLGPVLDEIAEEKKGAVKVAKVNVDEAGDLAVEYGIRNIPALFYFKGGELKHKSIGVQPKSDIVKRLESMD